MRYHEFKIVESLLFELTDKVKNQMREKFKGENPNLEDEKINYYLDRWDKYANTFEPQYRDITRLRYDQVKTMIDDAATKAELKGGGERKPVNPADDLIYDKNNLVVHKGDLKEKCIAYGAGYSWCISRKDASNMFHRYRMRASEPVFYFVFDKDKPEKDIWHKVVIYVDSEGVFKVATANNPGDKQMSWDEIEQKQPKLRGLKSLFKSQPLSPEERSDYEKYGKPVDGVAYRKLSLTKKYKYIRFGHKLSSFQQDDTPDELISVYAKLMPIYITRASWDRLKPRDKRYVQELQKQTIEQRPSAIRELRSDILTTEVVKIAVLHEEGARHLAFLLSEISGSFPTKKAKSDYAKVLLAPGVVSTAINTHGKEDGERGTDLFNVYLKVCEESGISPDDEVFIEYSKINSFTALSRYESNLKKINAVPSPEVLMKILKNDPSPSTAFGVGDLITKHIDISDPVDSKKYSLIINKIKEIEPKLIKFWIDLKNQKDM
jgi:hypothetical protein